MAQLLDAIVLGAGPAGCAVAARLLQRGVTRFAVLERYAFPRDKPCGGGLTGHADEALAALGLELRVPRVPAPHARVVYGAFERTIEMQRPVNVVRRIDFDADLVAQVRAKGADVREDSAAEAIAVRDDRVEVTLSGGRTVAARVLIGADGVASIARKHLVGERALPHRLFMQELAIAAPPTGADTMVYDFTAMPTGVRGYTWVFPSPAGVNVGIMHYPADRRGGPELVRRLREHLAPLGVALPMKGARGWPVWGYEPSARVAGPRVVVVGDAAGIDGLTGEGIAVAMEHGAIAGDHVARALATGDVAFRGYRRALRRAVVGRELALDRRLARMLYQRGAGWRDWMALVLFDADVLDMYAARVSGSQVLADQKWRLVKALGRHALARGRRLRQLAEALPERSALPEAA
nr:NAD(P)/FAD-dependent oxidoreductase [Kofleriaceae bacterium]